MSTDLQVAPQAAIAPMELSQMIRVAYQRAMEDGGPAALAVARDILQEMSKQRDYEDREAFTAALRRIQDKLKPITKDGFNPQTNSRFGSAEAVDNAIQALLQQEGMTLSFEPEANDQPNMVTIVGVLSMGAYSKRYPLPMPADGQGPKGGSVMTRTHATGAAITYAKRYLKNMIFDLRFKEKDDDGNGAAGEPETMDPELAKGLATQMEMMGTKDDLRDAYHKAMEACGVTVEDLDRADWLQRAKYQREASAFVELKNKLLKELGRKK